MTKKDVTLEAAGYELIAGLLCVAYLSLAIVALALTGCSPSDPEESTLDRIPNVPPSNRSQGEHFLPRPTAK